MKIGIIADELVDYSTWAKPYASLWKGKAVVEFLERLGYSAKLIGRDELSFEGFSQYDVVIIATDHTYPEKGKWGGPVAQALKEYVANGGIYIMPIGVPHYISKDIQTGELDTNHWDDFFGWRASVATASGELRLTKQGEELSLQNPSDLPVRPIRVLEVERSAVLIWSSDGVPCLRAIPYGKGWLVHWGGGEDMGEKVRDYWLKSALKIAQAAKKGLLRATTYEELWEEEGLKGKSLDDLDREVFAPSSSPFALPPIKIKLEKAKENSFKSPNSSIKLDGKWLMIGFPRGKGNERKLIRGEGWEEAIEAEVPCSVQNALFKAGKIPDPTVGFNDQIARKEVAEKEWWLRRDFEWKTGMPTRLVFEGVDYSATFYLNGVRLGEHEGPFGGPTFDITGIVRERNTLIVRLDPIPPDWTIVFKTNCVYGWHYVNCPPIGIWRSVRVEEIPSVEITDFFISTQDAKRGLMNLYIGLRSKGSFRGVLEGIITPANFKGETYRFSYPIQSKKEFWEGNFQFSIPNPRLWYPNGLGDQNLYKLEIGFKVGERFTDVRSTRFGIRTIKMEPLPDGPKPHLYNWTFVINGERVFVKGTNWATLDAFLRLDESRYKRFLMLAKDANIQLLRSWGGGLLETDTFYDICDELGIMVWQEFPLTWQKFDLIRQAVAEEIADINIRRLRNHPSLVLWCGGNEHSGQGWLIELLGRRCYELDGTRPYHRTDPYGGSIHNYDVYWGLRPLERNLELTAPFIGEFGLASPCSYESTLKYLPPEEWETWPPRDDSAFIHHTPTFTPQNMVHLLRYAKEFDPCEDLKGFIKGSQLAQATGIRVVLERMRTLFPYSTGVIYYKLTDVFPGCSWSTVDWYGVPKIAHYFVQDAYAPLQVVALFKSFSYPGGGSLPIEIWLLDDNRKFQGNGEVIIKLYDGELKVVEEKKVEFSSNGRENLHIANIELSVPLQNINPLLLLLDLRKEGKTLARNYYWFNFREKPGCLFLLPLTKLEARWEGKKVLVKNIGSLPAVGVHFSAPDVSDCLRFEDGYFWLEPGEEKVVKFEVMQNVDGKVKELKSLSVEAWNAESVEIGR
ncbi:beta-mannosidase [bacterium]|nr:beta-mannosidase [bacterium]